MISQQLYLSQEMLDNPTEYTLDWLNTSVIVLELIRWVLWLIIDYPYRKTEGLRFDPHWFPVFSKIFSGRKMVPNGYSGG